MTYNQTQQVVENGNRLRDNPGNSPGAKANGNPSTSGQETSLVHVVGALATEDADVDVLASHVSKNDTSNNDGRDGQAVHNSLHDGTGRGESGRGDIGSSVNVDDHGGHNVHGGINNLKHGQ